MPLLSRLSGEDPNPETPRALWDSFVKNGLNKPKNCCFQAKSFNIGLSHFMLFPSSKAKIEMNHFIRDRISP
jgi:hypothetical protein